MIEGEGYLTKYNIPKRLLVSILPAFFLFLFIWNVHTVLHPWMLSDLNNYGGFGATKEYSNLNYMQIEKNRYRFLTVGHQMPMLPIYYGLDNFAGLSDDFSMRRYYYTQHMCKVGYACELNDSHQMFICAHNSCPAFPLGFNIPLLEMVNIKYILIDAPVDNPEMYLVSSHKGVKANDIYYFTKSLTKYYFNSLSVVKPLYVYAFKSYTWPRVFSVNSVKQSKYTYTNDKFYSQLAHVPFNSVLIARGDSDNIAKLKPNKKMHILKYTFSKEGGVIETNGRGGALVFNQSYKPYWHANCSGKVIPIIPVNGLMMALQAPVGCETLSLKLS